MLLFNETFYLLEDENSDAENTESGIGIQLFDAETSADETAEGEETLEGEETASAPSGAAPYIVGGVAGGIALIALVLCIILLKKVSENTTKLDGRISSVEQMKQKIQKVEGEINNLQKNQDVAWNQIQILKETDEKLMDQINSIRLEPIQSNDNEEKINEIMTKVREQKEQLNYHDNALRQMQASQQALNYNMEDLVRQMSSLSSEVVNMQKQSVSDKPSQNFEFDDDFSLPEPPTSFNEAPLSYDDMLDLIDQYYNQAVFLSASSNMAGQLEFYADTERKAYVVVIGGKCYPNPYRFVNLDKNQETYGHLSVLAPIFELRNIINGNAKYGMEQMIPALVEQQEDNSIIVRKKGIISFC